MRHDSRLLRAVLFAIVLAPAVAILASILAFGVDVPWMDEWIAIGSLFEKSSLGTLGFLDLTSQHNEHRIFFPKLVCLALGSWQGWDVRRETMVIFLMAAVTAWNVRALLKATVGGGTMRVLALLFLANLLIFSPAQWANWLKGMQMALFLPPLCLTSALRLALQPREPWMKIGGAMILCTISTFSVGNGVLCWAVVLPPLVFGAGASGVSRKSILALWGTGLAVNVALYAYGYREPLNRPPLLFAFAHPLQSVSYFASFLGSPLAPAFGENSLPAAVILGVALLVLFIGCCLRFVREGGSALERSLAWMSIGAYSILTAAMTTVARAGMSDGQSLASRYVTFSLWLGVALIPLIAILLDLGDGERSPARLAATRFAYAGLLAFVALGTWPVSLRFMRDARATHLQGKACLQFAGVIEDLPGLRILHPRFTGLRDRILHVDRGGFLSPGLVRSRRAQDVAGEPSAECGVFEHLERHGDILVADGRARLPWRNEPADAILLAHARADGDSTIFAVFIAGRMRSIDGANGEVRWQAPFAASKLPGGAVSVSAWAFDALAGKAFRLRGAPPLR